MVGFVVEGAVVFVVVGRVAVADVVVVVVVVEGHVESEQPGKRVYPSKHSPVLHH